MKTPSNKAVAAYFAGIVMTLMAGVHQADATIQTFTVAKPTQLTEFNYSFVLPKFDLSLGTLTQVTIRLDSNLSTVLTVTNQASTSSIGSAQTAMKFYLVDPAQYLGTAPFKFGNTQAFDIPFAYNLAPGEQATSGLIDQEISISKNYTASNVLSEFSALGAQTLTLGLSTITSTLLDNTGGNSTAAQVTQGDSELTVTYTYNPMVNAPEPSSTAALLVLVGGSALTHYLRRRKISEAIAD